MGLLCQYKQRFPGTQQHADRKKQTLRLSAWTHENKNSEGLWDFLLADKKDNPMSLISYQKSKFEPTTDGQFGALVEFWIRLSQLLQTVAGNHSQHHRKQNTWPVWPGFLRLVPNKWRETNQNKGREHLWSKTQFLTKSARKLIHWLSQPLGRCAWRGGD